MQTHTTERYILLGVVGFFLAFALTVDYRRAVEYFFGDEAVYYMMAQSIAFDRDLEYTALDLQRVYEDGWHAGPLGIFLSKIDNGKIIYAKYPAYSLFLAPFLAIFGFNGFLVFNVLLWGGMIWMGWAYLRQFNPSGRSLFVAITFFLLSASFVYIFWVTPETFNMFCIVCGLFLWLYQKETTFPFPAPAKWTLITMLRWLVGTPQGRVYLAPIPIAIATSSKLPNILFLTPILADVLLIESETPANAPVTVWQFMSLQFSPSDIVKRLGRLLKIGIITVLVLGSFYGFQYLMTGQTNAYAGDRKAFYWQFPFGSQGDAWARGTRLSNDDYYEESFFFHPKTFLYNLYYYVFGRFTGMVPYFFCSIVALYFWLRTGFRWKLPQPAKEINWRRWFLGLAILGSILGYILIAPSNYQGGGGAFGNRFFLNIYPAFLFLITAMTSLRPMAIGCVVGSLFLAHPLLTPFKTSFFPASHAFHFPYRFLPVERTLVDTLPTNVNHHLMQTELVGGKPVHRLYFSDLNISDFSANGFWVQGKKAAELLLRTFEGQQYLVMTVINGPIPNKVNISAAGHQRSVLLTDPGEQRHLVFPLTDPMPFFKDYVYSMKVRSETGFIPTFTPGTDLNDLRYLGTWVSLSLSDAEAGRVYAEQGYTQEAIDILEPFVKQHPQDVAARYALGKAYHQAGNIQAAFRELEKSLSSLSEFQQAFVAKYNALNPENPLPDTPELPPEPTLRDVLAPITLSYEVEDLLRGTGNPIFDINASQAEAVEFQQDADTPGFLAYGQYVNLPAGQYQVQVHFKTHPNETSLTHPVAFNCDVYSQKYGIIAHEKVLLEGAHPQDYQSYTFLFEHIRPTPLEFRVKTTGSADVVLDKIDVYPFLPLQLYHTLSLAKNATGDAQDAGNLLHQVVEFDQWTPEFQRDYVRLLQQQQHPEDAVTFVTGQESTSIWHTANITYSEDHYGALQSIVTTYFTPKEPVEQQFENLIELIGCDPPPETAAPGGALSFQLYWKALRDIQENLVFSIRLVRQGMWPGVEFVEKVQTKLGTPHISRFSFDHAPLEGAYPTQDWLPGEYIRDPYTLILPSHLTPGQYAVYIEVLHPLDRRPLRSGAAQKINIGNVRIEG